MKSFIAITGATGFIGKKLVSSLLQNGENVRFLTRGNNLIDKAEAFIADINSQTEYLIPFFSDVSVIFNCVGELNNEFLMRGVHVNGTKNLLDSLAMARDKDNKQLHWIQLSSCGAYGRSSLHPSIIRQLDESSDDNPNGEYEQTKTEADHLIINFAKSHDWFKYTIVRPTIVFGEGMRSTAIASIAHMVKRNLFFYIGHNQTVANYVHVDDVASALVICVNNAKAFNQTFIVSNDCRLTDIVDKMAEAVNVNKPRLIFNEFLLRLAVGIVEKIVYLPLNKNKIDVLMRKTYYSNSKIKVSLGWQHGDVLNQIHSYVKNLRP